MTTRVISKGVVQLIIRELRAKGFKVEKTTDGVGYFVRIGDRDVFKAMRRAQHYLVRYDTDWWLTHHVKMKETINA